MKDAIEDQGGGGTGEGSYAGGHLVENDTEGKEIGAQVEGFSARLFRGHVGDGTDGAAGVGKKIAALNDGAGL